MAETDERAPVAGVDVPDPDQVPVRHVTGAVSVLSGGTIMLTLVTDRLGLRLDGGTYGDPIIAARLRFDIDMARRIRDQLGAHISGLTAAQPPNTKPN